jgi:hypothetical protein
MANILKHSDLGEIQGNPGDNVIQFLGIKYASIKDIFAPSKLFDHNGGSGVVNGTQLG